MASLSNLRKKESVKLLHFLRMEPYWKSDWDVAPHANAGETMAVRIVSSTCCKLMTGISTWRDAVGGGSPSSYSSRSGSAGMWHALGWWWMESQVIRGMVLLWKVGGSFFIWILKHYGNLVPFRGSCKFLLMHVVGLSLVHLMTYLQFGCWLMAMSQRCKKSNKGTA